MRESTFLPPEPPTALLLHLHVTILFMVVWLLVTFYSDQLCITCNWTENSSEAHRQLACLRQKLPHLAKSLGPSMQNDLQGRSTGGPLTYLRRHAIHISLWVGEEANCCGPFTSLGQQKQHVSCWKLARRCQLATMIHSQQSNVSLLPAIHDS